MADSQAPALLPLAVEAWDPSLSSIAQDMKGTPINVHKLMAHNPVLLKAWWDFRNYSVNGGTLGKRLGELVILRVGIQMSAWYEWGSHVDRSLQCGLTLEEINAVAQRKIGSQWRAREAALLSAVDELVEGHKITQDTQAQLAAHFTTPQILDIIAIHGMYVILACMINSFGLELDPKVNARIQDHTTPKTFRAAAKIFHAKQIKT